MKPIIGITVDTEPDPEDRRTKGKLSLNWNYAQVIADAGGTPILIPPHADPADIAAIIDGWLIPGGNDIDARHWGDELHPKAKLIASERFDLEQALYERIPKELPVLGICYGCQFLNVVEGGSLIQHLPEVVGHEMDQGGEAQEYVVEPDTLLNDIVGNSADGESWHHQAIGRTGERVKVNAHNPDGTIEGVEIADRPWTLGVQWHPERTPDEAPSRELFSKFVEAARQYRERRT